LASASQVIPQVHSLQAVVFDMDGVIVDSHPAHRYAWKEFLRGFGKVVSDRELDFVMDGRKRRDILSHFLGPLTDAQLQAYGKRKDELFWRATEEVEPVTGVLEFIECIRSAGLLLAVATSASASRTRSTLERLDLIASFTAIVTGDDVPDGKPHPDIYRLACRRINSPTTAVVAVEDAVSGVLAAKGAGLRCVGVSSCQSEEMLAAAGADCVLDNFLNLSLPKLESLIGMRAVRSRPS
jgi:beta-phosphoglucomutase